MINIALITCLIGALLYIITKLALTRPQFSDGGRALVECVSTMGKIAFGVGLLAYLMVYHLRA
jgi:ABC-type spermidine/putrescine transport system permease subunit II